MIQFTVEAIGAGPMFERKRDAILQALRVKMNGIHAALQAKILGKLTGGLLQSHTHNLFASVRVNPLQEDETSMSQTVQAGGGPVLYAKYLEDGTAPHRIRVVNKQALMFAIGGKQVFAKYVNHPGTRPYRFMAGSLEESTPAIIGALQSAVNEGAKA